jgi:hypothetical protein
LGTQNTKKYSLMTLFFLEKNSWLIFNGISQNIKTCEFDITFGNFCALDFLMFFCLFDFQYWNFANFSILLSSHKLNRGGTLIMKEVG